MGSLSGAVVVVSVVDMDLTQHPNLSSADYTE